MTGLYVSITPDGKIKRHLSTEHGEVPLKDTTVSDELISLTDCPLWEIYSFIKGALLFVPLVKPSEKELAYFGEAVEAYLTEKETTSPMYAALTRTQIADHTRNRKTKQAVLEEIIKSLRNPISAHALTIRVLDQLCSNISAFQLPNGPVVQTLYTTAVFTLDNTLSICYVFRSYEQYFHFLLLHFIASKPKIAKCQYFGGYFIPKTQRKILYCDRIVKDGKTCKQIAPYENHKKLASSNRVIAEFDLSKGRMLRRLERTGIDKKESPIDISDEDFCRWLEKAADAKNHYLAGTLSEEEALQIIHVPTIQELREKSAL